MSSTPLCASSSPRPPTTAEAGAAPWCKALSPAARCSPRATPPALSSAAAARPPVSTPVSCRSCITSDPQFKHTSDPQVGEQAATRSGVGSHLDASSASRGKLKTAGFSGRICTARTASRACPDAQPSAGKRAASKTGPTPPVSRRGCQQARQAMARHPTPPGSPRGRQSRLLVLSTAVLAALVVTQPWRPSPSDAYPALLEEEELPGARLQRGRSSTAGPGAAAAVAAVQRAADDGKAAAAASSSSSSSAQQQKPDPFRGLQGRAACMAAATTEPVPVHGWVKKAGPLPMHTLDGPVTPQRHQAYFRWRDDKNGSRRTQDVMVDGRLGERRATPAAAAAAVAAEGVGARVPPRLPAVGDRRPQHALHSAFPLACLHRMRRAR